MNKGTERLWVVNERQEECAHGFEESGRPSTQNYRGGGPESATKKQLSNTGTVDFMGAFTPSGLDGEHYTGSTRWQHVAEEAQEKGEKVRDVRGGAWTEVVKYPTMAAEGKPAIGAMVCTICGAWWGSLGLEPVADCKRPNGELCARCYVCHSVLILRALREILADDGLVFWNISDSYSASSVGSFNRGSSILAGRNLDGHETSGAMSKLGAGSGIKPKDLVGIPGRVIQALQEDGWFRRADIIWAKGVSFNKKSVRELLKPYREQLEESGVYEELAVHLEKNSYVGNSMPESVKDRPTRGYEHIFMLAKRPRYYSDMDAVREQHTDESLAQYGRNSNVDGSQPYAMKQGPRGSGVGKVFPQEAAGAGSGVRGHSGYFSADGKLLVDPDAGRNARNVWVFPTSGFGWQLCSNCGTVYDQKEYKALPKIRKKLSWAQKADLDGGPVEDYPNHQDGGDMGLMAEKGVVNIGICMNCGSTEGWGSHFSSFPIMLPEHAILMGSPDRVCSKCGVPWKRITKKTTRFEGGSGRAGRSAEEVNAQGKWALGQEQQYGKTIKLGPVNSIETLGWEPGCGCGEELGTEPAIVLDPFAGTGTSLLAALKHGRKAIGFELSADYAKIATERLRRYVEQESSP